MTERVLVPLDGSPLSHEALDVVLRERSDADVVALHVIDPFEPGYSVYDAPFDMETKPVQGSEEWYERGRELAAELFDDARDRAADYDVDLTTDVVVGRPERAIVEYADDHDIDHIVIGSHGRDEESQILLGSVTEAIAFRAPMRVSLVR